ncbi:MAG: hypothetical protein EOP55_02045 [Sphingobacteriales bacterium]|nr:MAG: hypothetical protein EOP55_02045 [Sphingobacteriales bacterium]
MGFLDLFRTNKQPDDSTQEIKASLTEIKEEDFIDNSEPDSDHSFIEYGSNLPIDIIYNLLKEDYEAKAYKDAITNPDRSYKEKNIALLRSTLEVKFKQITLKYDDMLREIDVHIKTRSEAGLTDLVELLKSRKDTLEKHRVELQQMKDDLNKEEPYIMGMFTSYEVGFTRGLASLSLHTLKINTI